jgi:hypothetical protein
MRAARPEDSTDELHQLGLPGLAEEREKVEILKNPCTSSCNYKDEIRGDPCAQPAILCEEDVRRVGPEEEGYYQWRRFIGAYGCDEYFKHNKEMLLYERQQEIIAKLEVLERLSSGSVID